MVKPRIDFAAEEHQREQRQEDGELRQRGSHDGLVDRQVDQLGQRHLLVFAQILANAVGDDDGLVETEADESQHGRDRRDVELEPDDREQPDGHDDVVRRGGDGGERELPLEAEPDVDQDRDERDEHGDDALGGQLARDLRAHGLGAADRVVVALAARRVTLVTAACCAGVAARLRLDADQHVLGRAELCTWISPSPSLSRSSRILPGSASPSPVYCSSIAEPPMKSMPRLKPLVKAEPMASIEMMTEKMIA